ncbi:MAG: hypothetical protein RhofKO_22200 [Rhodothermales bacterium]
MVLLAPLTVHAQDIEPWTYNHGLSIGYSAVDFTYAGDTPPADFYDYVNPAVSLVYTRPTLRAMLTYGTQDREIGNERIGGRELLEGSISTWAPLWFPVRSLAEGSSRFYVPVLAHIDGRRVSQDSDVESIINEYNFTVLGLGTGLAFSGLWGTTGLDARLTPIVGYAMRSFGDATGFSYQVEGSLDLHLGQLFGGAGLVAGYFFRYQHYDINRGQIFLQLANDVLDYTNIQHTVHLGVTF